MGESRARDASTHLLIVPRNHVQNCNCPEAIALLPHFVQVAETLHAGAMLSFHRPPFNSIDHLHMHVLVPPWKNCRAEFKHGGGSWKCWHVDAREMLQATARTMA